jgi:MSHA biogenesis protein MshG
MAEFSYSGRQSGGELVSGVLEATDQAAVIDQLASRGITPIQVEAMQSAVALPDLRELLRRRARVGLDELIMISRQLHSLVKAGVPINRSFAALAATVRNRTLQDALLEIERHLNTGRSLAASLRRHPTIFGNMYVSLIRVGENSGRLDGAFKQLADYLTLEKDTRRRVSEAMRYPSFVLIAITVAIFILNWFVIPVFAGLFERFNSELPLPTRILIGTSDFFLTYWWLLLAIIVAAVFAVPAYLRTETGRLRWDKARLRLPLVGDIIVRSTLARFARSFSMMLSAGVPLPLALDLCAEAVDNVHVGGQISTMRQGIERGDSLYRTAAASGMFTPLVMQMIAIGEETGQVDELLLNVAEFYEQEVDYDLKSLSARIEPILLVLIAGVVLVLALGVFLPMWDMYQVVQN